MNPILRNLALGAAVFTAMVTLAGGSPNFAASAQTATPPVQTAATLSEATMKALQEALNKQGIAVKADGTLSDETRAAIRKYQSQHHLPITGEPDKATLEKLGVADRQGAAPDGPAPSGQTATAPGATGQTMGRQMMPTMPPGMMGQGMMGGTAGPGSPQSATSSGMMGMGQMPMATAGTATPPGMTMCPMMGMMTGMGMGASGAMGGGPGAVGGIGPDPIYGMARGARVDIDADKAKAMIERMLVWHDNPRLKLGEVRTTDYGEVVADVVTREGSLVQRLAIDRRTGSMRQID